MRMPIKYTYNFPAASKYNKIQTYKYISIHTHKPVQIHTNTYKSYKYIQNRTENIQNIQIHTNTYKHIHAYTNIQTYMPTYLRTYIYTHVIVIIHVNVIYIFIQYRIEYAITKLCPVGVSYYTRRTTRGSRGKAPACASWPRFSGTILLGCPKFTWGFP